MSLKISELNSYHTDIARYQRYIDNIIDTQERVIAQSLLRDYKNLVNRIDTKIENIVFDDIKKVLSSQRQDSSKLYELRQQLERLAS
jgi:hypothetical protein